MAQFGASTLVEQRPPREVNCRLVHWFEPILLAVPCPGRKKNAMEKTLAMRALEGKRIPYEVLTYPDDLRDAEEIALLLDLPAAEVFKTLVVLPPEPGKKPLLVMIPADTQLDLKKLAAAVGAKKLKMATHHEAETLTGLQVGGISAVALLNKGFAVYIDRSSGGRDRSSGGRDRICVSAGKRGLQLRLAAADLIKLTNARPVDVATREAA